MFAKDKVSQSLIDAVTKVVGITEAKAADELPPIDKDAAAARKARQARLDAIEDAKAEKESGEKKPSTTRTIAGKAYGGSKQKDDDDLDEEVEMDESGLRMAAHAAHKAGQKNFDFQGKKYPVRVSEDGKVQCDYNKVKTIAKKEVKGHEKAMHNESIVDTIKNITAVKNTTKQKSNMLKEEIQIVEAEDSFEHGRETLSYGVGTHPEVAKELHKHAGKIQAIFHNTKDNAMAAVVHNTEDGVHGDHHVLHFINNKKVHTTIHPTFGDAEAHGVKTVTTKKGLAHLNKMHGLMKEEAEVADKKTGEKYNPQKKFDKLLNHPDTVAQLKRMKDEVGKGWPKSKSHSQDESIEEETMELDELSKGTLSSYAKKASSSSHEKSASNLASRAAYKLSHSEGPEDRDDGEKDDRKSFQRSKGISRAIDRLTKEGVELDEAEELDELSKGTLSSYKDKAMQHMVDKKAKLGMRMGTQADWKRIRGIENATSKMGSKKESVEEETLDEISAGLVSRYSDKASKEYNDPKTPEHKKSTRRAGLMTGYNKAKGRARVPATYEETSFADRLLQRAKFNESRGPVAGAGETFTDNNIGEMSAAQTAKKEKIVMSMKKKEGDFKAKYGKNWKNVMYATATKLAMAEDYVLDEDKDDGVPFDKPYSKTPANVTDKGGNVHTPLSRVKHLAKAAMKKLTKETMMGKAGTTSEETENE